MKKLTTTLLFLSALICLSCQHDEQSQQGTVQFSFSNIASGNTGGRKQTDQIPDGASLILSVTKSNGDSVFTWKKIELLKVGNQFITNPLPLLQGGYVITDFMILGADNTLLFIAPKQGSALATLVTKTIPISFNVSINAISNVEVEVVDVNHKNPQDFGYASFPIKVIPNSGFSVSTFTVNKNGQMNLTTARAYVLHEHDSILTQNLKGTVNNVNWVRGTNNRFSLVITKDGYARYEKDFDLDSMMTALNGQPLAVVLQPAFTISWTAYPIQYDLTRFSLEGTPGSKIRIDWGDGSIENFTFTEAPPQIHHIYQEPVKYFFSVTGDLDAIHSVDFAYSTAKIDTMSIASLPALDEFFMVFFDNYAGKGIDFSNNPKLQSVDFSYSNVNFQAVDFSKNPLLTYISLEHNPLLTTAIVDKVIDDVFASVVLHNTRNGVLNLIANRYDQPEIVGNPSPEQVSKLYSMINNYGWKVYPLVLPF